MSSMLSTKDTEQSDLANNQENDETLVMNSSEPSRTAIEKVDKHKEFDDDVDGPTDHTDDTMMNNNNNMNDGTKTLESRSIELLTDPAVDSLPHQLQRPIKRARTAYFIFADEKRPEIQSQHPGEGVTVVARILGQMWSSLNASEKEKYQLQAGEERERVSKELQLQQVNMNTEVTPNVDKDPTHGSSCGQSSAKSSTGGKSSMTVMTNTSSPLSLVLPVARIRKISKLDPEVKGLSREALMLITKCAEMVTTKLAQESVRVAQLQNRRKILPDDVAQVCQTREQFLFLKDDVKDLVQEQRCQQQLQRIERNKCDNSQPQQQQQQHVAKGQEAASFNTKPLTAYFGGIHKDKSAS